MRKVMLFIAIAALLLPAVLLAQAHQSGWRESGHPYTVSELTVVEQPEGLPALTQKEGEQVSAQFYYSLNQWAETGDPTGYVSLLTPDVRFIRLGDATDVEGIAATVAAINNMSSDVFSTGTVSFVITKVEMHGRYVISTGVITGTHIGTGGQLAVPFDTAVLIDEEGKVSAIVDGTDFPTLAEQIYIAYMYNVCDCEDMGLGQTTGDVTVETQAVTYTLTTSGVIAWSWGAVKNMGK